MSEVTFQNLPIDPHTLPAVEEQPWYGLDTTYQTARQIAISLQSVFLLILIIVAISLNGAWGYLWVISGAGLLWGAIIVLRILWLAKGFSRMQYALRERDITYRRGLLQHTVTSVPFHRVQHCEVNQSAIERSMKLARLQVYTAGGSSSDLTIPGLPLDRASELKDYVLTQAYANDHSHNS